MKEIKFYINDKIENETLLEDRESSCCDICKKDVSTEKFIGYCGNVLYLCSRCLKNLK